MYRIRDPERTFLSFPAAAIAKKKEKLIYENKNSADVPNDSRDFFRKSLQSLFLRLQVAKNLQSNMLEQLNRSRSKTTTKQEFSILYCKEIELMRVKISKKFQYSKNLQFAENLQFAQEIVPNMKAKKFQTRSGLGSNHVLVRAKLALR